MNSQADINLPDCHDCGAAPGEIHGVNCDVEQCTVCGDQFMLCDHPGHDKFAARWTGEWPGSAEARERGWFVVFDSDGWRPCTPETPGAQPDLSRWAVFNQTGRDQLYRD